MTIAGGAVRNCRFLVATLLGMTILGTGGSLPSFAEAPSEAEGEVEATPVLHPYLRYTPAITGVALVCRAFS